MKTHLREGWRAAVRHRFVILLLFVYRLLWGFAIYRLADAAIRPLLLRFPGAMGDDEAMEAFIREAQFRLLKTDLLQPWLWTLAAVIAVRMLISPLINAGLTYSLVHADSAEGGTLFLRGIRKAWRPVLLLYVTETALALAPGIRLLPDSWTDVVRALGAGELHLGESLPYAAGWLLWGFALHLLFVGLRLGIVAGHGTGASLAAAARRLPGVAAVTLAMIGIGMALGLVSASASFWWAGLLALVIHQGYQIVQTFLDVWTAGAQCAVWRRGQSV